MNDFIVMIIAHNEKEFVKMTIESIRMFPDVENLYVIVADNFSSDGLRDWAEDQTDFNYVYMDEGQLSIGQVINGVVQELDIQGDVLIMGGHYLLTPGCLSRMQDVLYADNETGAVGCLSNGFKTYQLIENISDYEEAVNRALSIDALDFKNVTGLYPDAILFRRDFLKDSGSFDESFLNQYYLMKDYCLRGIMKGWKLKVCNSALLWDIYGENNAIAKDADEERQLENKWGMHYFNSMYNQNIIGFITKNKDEEIYVLEIGCDCGATLLEIKNRYPNAHIYGCELNEKAAAIASHFASVTTNNIEEQNLNYENEMFDYIIFGDVLEHLMDPLSVIKYCSRFLKSDGYILASIPNLMHISVMEELLKGNFTYTETGLLDKAHVHFFTYHEIIKMFREGGYQVENVNMMTMPISSSQEELIKKLLILQNGSAEFMYKAFQYLVCARKL